MLRTRSILGVALLLLGGCTHRVDFVRAKPWDERAAPALGKSVTLSLSAVSDVDPRLMRKLHRALCGENVGSVLPPAPGREAQYALELHVKRTVHASWLNFPITWPGFLVFAPAWYGLEWPYEVTTLVTVTRKDAVKVAEVWHTDTLTASYTSNPYGVGAGLGWCPLFLTLPALVTAGLDTFVVDDALLDDEFVLREGDLWADTLTRDILTAIAQDLGTWTARDAR